LHEFLNSPVLLHAPAISTPLFSSLSNYKVPHYAVFCSLTLFHSSLFQIFASAALPCSQIRPLNVTDRVSHPIHTNILILAFLNIGPQDKIIHSFVFQYSFALPRSVELPAFRIVTTENALPDTSERPWSSLTVGADTACCASLPSAFRLLAQVPAMSNLITSQNCKR
jgi:hypothetical protein